MKSKLTGYAPLTGYPDVFPIDLTVASLLSKGDIVLLAPNVSLVVDYKTVDIENDELIVHCHNDVNVL